MPSSGALFWPPDELLSGSCHRCGKALTDDEVEGFGDGKVFCGPCAILADHERPAGA